jgi:hypothetical protein
MIDLIFDLCFCLGFYNFKMVASSSHVYCFLGVWPKGELPTGELWFRRVMFKPRPLFPTTTPNFKLSRCFLELTYESYVWHNSLSLTLGVRKQPVVPVSYRERIRVGWSEIIFLNIFFMFFFSIISVTTDAILAAARNHPEKIGSHCQSRWKNNRVGRKNRVGKEPQVFFFTPYEDVRLLVIILCNSPRFTIMAMKMNRVKSVFFSSDFHLIFWYFSLYSVSIGCVQMGNREYY